MTPWKSRWVRLAFVGACLGAFNVGCGGGDVPDPDSDPSAATETAAGGEGGGGGGGEGATPSVEQANAAARQAQAAAQGMPGGGAPPAAAAPAPGATAEAAPATVEVASNDPPVTATKGDSSATEELLRQSGNSPAPAGGAATETAASSPGGAGGASAAPAGFPGGQGAGQGPGFPAAPGSNGQAQAYPAPAGPTGGEPGSRPRGMQGPPGAGPDGQAGAQGGAAREGGPGGPGFPGQGGPGGPGGDLGSGPADFTTPHGAVVAFLRALRAKDKDQISEATALRAGEEAALKNRKLFASLAEKSATDEEISEMDKALEGYSLKGTFDNLSSAKVGIALRKVGENEWFERTVIVRREKAGWKVLDIGGTRVEKMPGSSLNRARGKTARPR